MKLRIAIIGAGAAGCFAAANMPLSAGLEVAIFEKTGKALQKVKASGGGRCNVTHACFDVPELLTRYPRGKALLKKTLYRFGCADTMQWFQERGVQLKTEADGRIFPATDDSQTIIDCIWRELNKRNVQVYYHKAVASITKDNAGIVLTFGDNTTHTADAVLVASGGFPKAEQYQWLLSTGHTIQAPVPSLFTFNTPNNPISQLMGVSEPGVTVRIAGTKQQQSGPVLITHWGFSGPGVLKTSAFAARELAEKGYDFTVLFNWLGGIKEADVVATFTDMRQQHGKQLVLARQPFALTRRLWEHFCTSAGITGTTRWGELTSSMQNRLLEHLLRDGHPVKGKTTFKEEFVTCGGIPVTEVKADTMESKLFSGLYFAGEILDVDGITGGYNFQHAWSSSYIAAQSMSNVQTS